MTFLGRLFGEGFRIFFLAAGLYAVFTLVVWEGWLGIHAVGGMVTQTPFAPTPHVWHAHEMIFGFAGAALGGFFLTAVPNWTGTRAAQKLFIAAVSGLWLAGRVAVWFSASLPPVVVAFAALAFLPVLATKIASQLIQRPKPQNVMFLGILGVIWLGDLLVQAEWMGLAWGDASRGLRAGLFGTVALIAILGGRITPAFTRNAMTRAGHHTRLPGSRKQIDAVAMASAIALPVAVLANAPEPLTGAIALGAGLGALGRLSQWRPGWTLPYPILWAMHLAYAALGVGYVLIGLSALGYGSEVSALHVLGIGAVGGMTIAVMSRASLGHTGRPLIASPCMTVGYGLVALAALFRWIGSTAFDFYYPAVLASGALWIAAFTLFLVALLPALLGPRMPRPGES